MVTTKEEVIEGTLVDEILGFTKISQSDESYPVVKQGVEVLLKEVLDRDQATVRVDKSFVDQLIEELDLRLSAQMDAILHNETFQELEKPWASLNFLVNRTDFSQNIKVQILNATKDDLAEDFEDAPEITQTGLYRRVYTDEYGQFGGEPFGVIIGDYSFNQKGTDIDLLKNLSAVSAMTHAPFIASASNEFFGIDDYSELPSLKELESIFDGAPYTKWRSFRETDDARYVGLTLPKFMLRPTYGEDAIVRNFNYKETITEKGDYLWGNAAYAYASRLVASFAEFRWCPNIIGPQSGGAVEDLAIDVVDVDGSDEIRGPVEVVISDRKEYELAELGFIPLTLRKGGDHAVFFSSNAVQKAIKFGNDEEGQLAELNYKLGTQLPYLFIVCRLAHYIKVLQRENLGSWKTRADLQTELNKWLRRYVADQENPSPATRSARPLRNAELTVSEVKGEAGWYTVSLSVTPHFKFMGANFTLSLSGMLDRN
ncbi:type VI secretion system contractile sheath large subunit [Psychrosphaera sp. F3M07]|jgi:type VI secretion system protein ImpC|uniref:Type VI secretion system contractile sheath large subunit n=1 Tax=Psychrosphaera aquimarina TaxID=2044854 RepID=A0ABU3QW56_9GAMM|nr:MULTISPECIES: type VI secretion system contractile sheath large subunit [Psychrosphaera]MBU2918676.1 type VI secretion system contractile sheath large subunit [Psychrosphaera sp. F3M07]MDU0111669.1 type VI secretion system contractile sheath large subunit [Psychrosphaera aquimarina]